jgi:hypothetical protein
MASSVFIYGNVTGDNCVDGVAKVGLPGRRSNILTTINTNPASAAELTAINSETTHTLNAVRDTVSPEDTKFCNNSTGGDYRFFSVASALTGSDLTNAQEYAGIGFT